MIREKRMILTIGILAVFQIVSALNTNFWSIFITKKLGIADSDLALYTTLKSLVIMGCVFLVAPRMRFSRDKVQ